MYATAAKPLSHNAFSRGNPFICGYETIPSKKVKRFHTGKWSLCDCIHLLRLVEADHAKQIHRRYRETTAKPKRGGSFVAW